MNNKRGAELTVGTVILILLGIAVLVFLILGFTTGWDKFMQTIFGIGGKSNIDKVKTSCDLACSTNSQYSFCVEGRDINEGKGDVFLGVTCAQLAKFSPQYGIASCNNIICKDVKPFSCNNFVEDNCKDPCVWKNNKCESAQQNTSQNSS